MRTKLSVVATMVVAASGCVQVEKFDDAGDSVPTEVQRVFDARCATGGCHDAGTRQAGLSLGPSDAPGVIGQPSSQNSAFSLVELGAVDQSYLAAKILPSSPGDIDLVGDTMPPGADLSNNDLATDMAIIVGWIAGAGLPGGEGGSGGDDDDDDDGLQACGILGANPGATSPIDAGIEAGQIPTSIGTVLANNCGCHYVAETTGDLSGWTYNSLPIATLDDFVATYPGANPDYAGLQTREAVLDRVGADRNMPPAICVVPGGSNILSSDFDALVAWLQAGSPDAPTWGM